MRGGGDRETQGMHTKLCGSVMYNSAKQKVVQEQVTGR